MAEKPTGTPIPRVSVVVCTYNGARFLRPQLDSLLAQRLPPYEIIISDDDSTDDTAAIVREYAARDARVKLHINRPALGFNLNFSKAFQLAEGDYVASCDQDDIWHPDKLSHLVEALKHAPLAFHNSALFTENPAQPSGLKNPHNPVTNELFLLLKPYIPGHECVFRRELLRDYADIVAAEPHISYDTLLCLAGATHGGITYVDEALVSWRRHRPRSRERVAGTPFCLSSTSFNAENKHHPTIFPRCGVLAFSLDGHAPRGAAHVQRRYL